MTIEAAISFMKAQRDQLRDPIPLEGVPPMRFDCQFAEQGVGPEEVATVLPTCPTGLIRFWHVAKWARLFEDRSYGQWGLHILTPSKAAEETRKQRTQRGHAFCDGDLVVGRFMGDSDLLVVRCNQTASDFGKVLIALPLDPRSVWYEAADSFEHFIEIYLNARGEKYWEAQK